MDNDAGTRTGLKLHYTIEEELYHDRPLARVRFADSVPDRPSEVHRNITLRPDDMGIFQCSREVVYLMVRRCVNVTTHLFSLDETLCRQDLLKLLSVFPTLTFSPSRLQEGSRDILRALRFKLTYEIIQKEPRPVAEGDRLPDINEYPILNQKGALR